MTCIVGIVDKKNKFIIIGGDSAASSSVDYNLVRQPKVFRNGDFIFGCTSSFRMMQLIQFYFKPPRFFEYNIGFQKQDNIITDEIIYQYMTTVFVDELRNTLIKGGWLTISNNREYGGEFIVGFRDKLYKIQNDLSVLEYIDDFCAAGCGENFALGSLFSSQLNNSDLDYEVRVKNALMTAARYSMGVSAPFHLINSKSFEINQLT